MAAKGYNAGTIFLQVVPVFHDVQRSIRDQAKDLNGALKQDAKEAGRQAREELKKELGKDPVKVPLDEGDFVRRMRNAARSAGQSLGSEMGPEIDRLRSRLKELSDPKVTPKLDSAKFRAEIIKISQEIKRINGQSADVQVRANTGSALKSLFTVRQAANALDGKDVDLKVDMKGVAGAVAQMGALNALLGVTSKNTHQLAGSGEAGANSFRSFNIVILAAVTLLPALIPVIGAVGGALMALVPILAAVTAGIGVAVLAFSGIADAVKAMADVDKNAAKDKQAAATKMRSANEQLADAERNLANARRSAAQASEDADRQVARAKQASARAIEDALDGLADAERNYAQAQRDAREAQENLREARRAAQQDLEDFEDRRKGNQLDIDQAVVDVFNATVDYNTTQQDGAATNLEKEQSRINLEQARLRLKDLRDEQKEMGKEKRKLDREGVNGTDRVESAQDALTAALERQREAQEAVGEAAERVREARVDGAQAVADAVRSQQRTEADGARAVQDAQRNLTRAQQDYRDAVYETGVLGSASMQTLEDAMGKLGPAGRKFARFIYSLRDEFHRLRADAQEALLPGVQQGLQTIMDTYGPAFRGFVVEMSETMGGLFEDLGATLAGKSFQRFFGVMRDLGPGMLENFGGAALAWLEVFADLLTIAAPYGDKFAKALRSMAEDSHKFTSSPEGVSYWTRFMEYAERVGPKVKDFFKSILDATIAIGVALAPWGEMVMGFLTGMFELIAKMPPKLLGALAIALLGLATAFQVAVGAVALIFGGMAIAASPLATIVFWIVLAVAAIAALYAESETFRKIVKASFEAVGKAGKWLWEKALKPAFKAIYDYIQWGWKYVWKPYLTLVMDVWATLWDALVYAWEQLGQPLFDAIAAVVIWVWDHVWSKYLGFIWDLWTTVFRGMKWAWKNILWPVLDLIGRVIMKLWSKFFKYAIDKIRDHFENMARGIKWAWNNIAKPALDKFMEVIGDDLVRAFRTAGREIKKIWNSLMDNIAGPVYGFVDKVINGILIKSFNRVAKWAGAKGIDPIDVPVFKGNRLMGGFEGGATAGAGAGGFARGGIPSAQTMNVYPGYTPGRDVGYIGISGGEAIMRPEFTRALGPDWVNHWNAVARAEGVGGVKRRMGMRKYGAFARGGIVWPTLGRQTSTYRGHDGVDINRGSGWDDYGDPIVSATGGRVSYVGSGRGYGNAIFIQTPYGELVYGHTSTTSVRPGMRVRPGQYIGAVGNTGNSSAPHLHFGFPGGTYAAALGLLNGAMMPGEDWSKMAGAGAFVRGQLVPKGLRELINDPGSYLRKRVDDKVDGMLDTFGHSGLMNVLTKAPGRLIESMVDRIGDVLGHKVDRAANENIPSDVRDSVREVAANYGWGSGRQWQALVEIIGRESGWDPNAANPNSSARGLFQKMTSIHGPLEGSVADQARWGLGYIASRYGNPAAALAFHNSHGYYSDGGVVGSSSMADNGTMMYDNGGYLPPGLTTVVNLTGKPEPVFTADQFDRMGEGGSGEHFTYAPTFEGSDLTADDVANDVDKGYRRMKRRGKYGRTGS